MTTGDRVVAGICSVMLVGVSIGIGVTVYNDYRILLLLLGAFVAGVYLMIMLWPKKGKE